MKKLILILSAITLLSCSSDDQTDNCECMGQFGNTQTGEYIYQQTDCDRIPPSEEYVFIKCVNEPGY